MVLGYLIVSTVVGLLGAAVAAWGGATFLLCIAAFYAAALPAFCAMVALALIGTDEDRDERSDYVLASD